MNMAQKILLIVGAAFAAIGVYKKSVIVKKGTRYPAKIYRYTENTAYMVNGRFTVNVIVHYFDKNQIEREAVIPTAEAALNRGDLFVEEVDGKIIGTAILNQIQVPEYAQGNWQYPAPEEP